MGQAKQRGNFEQRRKLSILAYGEKQPIKKTQLGVSFEEAMIVLTAVTHRKKSEVAVKTTQVCLTSLCVNGAGGWGCSILKEGMSIPLEVSKVLPVNLCF